MNEYLIQKETLTLLADEVRELNGVSGNLTPMQMKTNLDSANVEVASQKEIIASIANKLNNYGGAGSILLQSKVVSTSDTIQDVRPDAGYDGLSSVVVYPPTSFKSTSGEFTVTTSGDEVSISCGFKPDIVYITARETMIGGSGERQDCGTGVDFNFLTSPTKQAYIQMASSRYGGHYAWIIQYNSGFGGVFGNNNGTNRVKYYYTAIKYT